MGTKTKKRNIMGKKIDTDLASKETILQKRKVRMAYSLNNAQPVLCTMVSDQPFFYIEEDIDDEEDFFLSDEFLESEIEDPSLVNELLSIKNKIDAYESIQETHSSKDDVLETFITDIDAAIISTDVKNAASIEDVFTVIEQSKMAQALYEHVKSNNINIVESAQVKTAYFDVKAQTIFIAQNLNLDDKVILFVRECRRVWQQSNNANVNPLALHPDDAVVVNRSQKADLDHAIVRCAWEMRLANNHTVWNRMEQSEYQDLARAFAREALSDFRTLNSGKAAAVLFETWFLSNRCAIADKSLIDMMLSEYKDYVNTETQSLNPFDILCRLGEQPYGKNYLSGYANMIVEDTLFTEVRDRSSANFLWFIKFERDFDRAEKIAEQQLQPTGSVTTSGAIDDLVNNENLEDTPNEKILAFPMHSRAEQRSNATLNQEARIARDKTVPVGNNIIPLSFGNCGSNKSGA